MLENRIFMFNYISLIPICDSLMAKHFQIFDGEPWEYRENISKKTYTK